MRTFVDLYGIAVALEEIHRIGGAINEVLRNRGDTEMRRLDNGARGGPYYMHYLDQDPYLEFYYNFVDWPGDSWEQEEFKELTILLDVMSTELASLQSLEPDLLKIGFVKVRRKSFIPGDIDSQEVHFQLSKGAASQ